MMKLNKNLTNFLLICVSLLLSFAVLELALRKFYPLHLSSYIGAYQFDEELGFRLKNDVHFLNLTDYQQEVGTNKLGTVNYQESFHGYQKLAFAIGDSYTQGTGSASDENYPFLLDMILNMNDGVYSNNIGVVNLGLAAYGLEQSILLLHRYSQKLGAPKYVLYLRCSNDYDDDLKFRSGYRHSHLVDGNPKWGPFLKPLQFLTNEIEVFKRLKYAFSVARTKAIQGANYNEKTKYESQLAILSKLKKISDQLGAKLIVSQTDAPPHLEYAQLQEWAKKNGVAFADWGVRAETMKKNIPKLPMENPHSGGHYRTWVNILIAEAFAEAMKD